MRIDRVSPCPDGSHHLDGVLFVDRLADAARAAAQREIDAGPLAGPAVADALS